jgi:hypothetical protein
VRPSHDRDGIEPERQTRVLNSRLFATLAICAVIVPAAASAVRADAAVTRDAAAARSTAAPAVKAFDTTATIHDPGWFVGMAKRGFRLYILHSTKWGTCTPWPNTPAQIKMALDAGLAVAVYTRDPRCWRSGIRAARPYVDQLQFFALDVETDPGVRVTRAMVDGVRKLGVRPVIYSGWGMWANVMGRGSSSFSDVPLWDTDTSSPPDISNWSPDLSSPTPVAYGGWNTRVTMRKGVQQAFEVKVDGVAVDLNSFDASFLR